MEMNLLGTTPLSFVNFIVADRKSEKALWFYPVFVERAITVKHAEKFILSDEVSKSVQNLSKTTNFAKQIAINPGAFRSPYKNTWMEMQIETPTSSTRVGFLIEEKKPRLYYFSFFDACFSKDKLRAVITPSIFCVKIDLRDESFLEIEEDGVLLDKDVLMSDGLTSEESDLAIHRVQIIPDPVLVRKHGVDEFYERVGRTDKRQGGSVVEDAYVAASVCIGAWLTLLNAKTGLQRSSFSEETIEKKLSFGSRKQKNIVKNNPYTILSISDYEHPDGTPRADHVRNQAMKHYVKGHFKMRKSGIYWWNAFLRGHGEYTARDAYIVKEPKKQEYLSPSTP